DFAVLFRVRTSFPVFEDAFRAAGIPFSSDGGRRFYDRIEVAAAAAVLRAVNHPKDPLAVAAALRSPLYGFSDDDLARHLLGLPGHPDHPEEVGRALEEIGALNGMRSRMSARAMLEEIFARTRALELFLSMSHGEQRVANLLKLLDLAFTHDKGGARGAAGFGAFLDRNLAMGEDAKEPEAAVLGAEGEAVRLMTIHGAKGLEFPAVALADLGGSIRADSPSWIVRRGAGAVDLSLGPKDRRLMTRRFREAEEAERAHGDAERKRLLYVAATRARDYLLVPLFPAKRGKTVWTDLEEAGAGPGAMREEACGPAESFEAALPDATEDEGVLRIPDAAFAPDEERISRSLAERKVFAEELEAIRDFGEKRPPLAASRLADLAGVAPTGAQDVAPTGARAASEEEEEAAERYGISPLEAEAGASPGAGSRGRKFGLLVHALLARLEPPTEETAERLAGEAASLARGMGLERADAEEAAALLRRAAGGDLLRRAAAAPRRRRELPFFFSLEERLIRGRADLVFEEGGGFVIADFKTDAVEGEALRNRADQYAVQGAIYALGIEAATGGKVGEVVFSFLRAGTEAPFSLDGALRERARLAVRRAG
ncbi:MAG: 3'-5' exonuclease, partial [bacterium]